MVDRSRVRQGPSLVLFVSQCGLLLHCHGEVSAPKVLVATLVLPDGIGDVMFGENAVNELLLLPQVSVTWIRVYPSDEHRTMGEALLKEMPSAVDSIPYSTSDDFEDALRKGKHDHNWTHADQIFLAPWIFGLYSHQVPLLELAKRAKRQFFALSEYGRGMGPIHEYTHGYGINIPTGWPSSGDQSQAGGVFKTIMRSPQTKTDWRRLLATELGFESNKTAPRIWWAYGRKDSSSAHAFRMLTSQERSLLDKDVHQWLSIVKIIPVREDGTLATGVAKTTGELLREQMDKAMTSPEAEVSKVSAPLETMSGVAGQLSELLVYALTKERSAEEHSIPEFIVAPNLDIASFGPAAGTKDDLHGHSTPTIQVVAVELVRPSGQRQLVALTKPVLITARQVPRVEMRTFLEQCESAVVATGDQSVAEAVLLGKMPLFRPDAKPEQWERALAVAAGGPKSLQDVPDLGASLQKLVTSPTERSRAKEHSKARSAAVKKRLTREFGSSSLDETHEMLVRAGMYG